MKPKIESKKIREFEFEGNKFLLVEPSAAILREAKFRYNQKYTNCLKEGYYTRNKIMSVYTADDPKNDIFEIHNKQRQEILKNLIEHQNNLDEAKEKKNADDIRTYASLLTLYRNALMQEDSSISVLFECTVEQQAQEERVLYLTYGMIRTTDNKPLWESYSEFLDEESFAFIEACKYQVMCWDWGLDPGWQEQLPETMALKELDSVEADKKAVEPPAVVGDVQAAVKPKNPVKRKKKKQ